MGTREDAQAMLASDWRLAVASRCYTCKARPGQLCYLRTRPGTKELTNGVHKSRREAWVRLETIRIYQRQIPCPKCGAGKDEFCVGMGARVHGERIEEYYELTRPMAMTRPSGHPTKGRP